MAVEQFRRDDVEGRFVRGREDDRRGVARSGRLEPAEGAQAPSIPADQPGESPLWLRRDEVIADRHREGEEIGGHHGADGVGSRIGGDRPAATVAEEAGQRRVGTGHERLAEHIAIGRWFGGSWRAVEGDHRLRSQRRRGGGRSIGDGAFVEDYDAR